ncbi:MAG: YicC/YloC family endoribonuclease [Rhizobiaceae bacterium]
MTLQSMTGFARIDGDNDRYSWVWELRSVNGKGLDLRFRIPPGFESVEVPARQAAQKLLKRGNIQITLQVRQNSENQVLGINEKLVDELIEASRILQKKIGGELPDASDILAIRGVVEIGESDDGSLSEKYRNEILLTFERALKELVEVRTQEGVEVGKVISEQISGIEKLHGKIEKDPSRSSEQIRKTIKTQVERLISESETLDEQRLYQEAAILAAKADIQEELDRLNVHVGAARDLISAGGPVGRKLDFLAQEFNRECNTICSKSNSATLTALGLDMKLIIDQFREQLQNME